MAEERAVCEGSGASLDCGPERGGGGKAGKACTEMQSGCEQIDTVEAFDEVSRPNDKVFSSDMEHCIDDELSDAPEPFPEAWVADVKCYFHDDFSEEDDSNLLTDAIPSQPHSLLSYEPEDWDAEMLALENPYDKEDLVDMSCGEHIAPIDDTLDSDGSYLPSLCHAASIQFIEARNGLHRNFEADQFEDADL